MSTEFATNPISAVWCWRCGVALPAARLHRRQGRRRRRSVRPRRSGCRSPPSRHPMFCRVTDTRRRFFADGAGLSWPGDASGQRLNVSTNAGSSSDRRVTTDANGTATVQLTAPGVNSPATSALVRRHPIRRMVTPTLGDPSVHDLTLSGPGAPMASFNWSPSAPGRFDLVTFDATNTTLNGLNCLDDCTYTWDFSDGTGSGSDRVTPLQQRWHVSRWS